MCWKKKPPPVIITPAKRRLITFGKNLYGGQDLNGCWNDSVNLSNFLKSKKDDFDLRKFRDYDVTADRYLAELSGGIAVQNPGATTLIIADSCFSETITRYGLALMNKRHPTKNRLYYPGLPPRYTASKIFSQPATNHIVISGCQEHETSADVYLSGQYVGALTWFLIKAYQVGMTYKEWYYAIRQFLPSQDITQTPTFEGPDYLANRVAFEDDTLIIHNSSHGSYTYDKSGDEIDGQDEGLYFDRLLIDDEIGNVLKQIRA